MIHQRKYLEPPQRMFTFGWRLQQIICQHELTAIVATYEEESYKTWDSWSLMASLFKRLYAIIPSHTHPDYMILLVYILLVYYISLFETTHLFTHMSKKLFVQWNDIQEKN